VSARTGEYRFLDLPGYPAVSSFDHDTFGLSADGTRLASCVRPGSGSSTVDGDVRRVMANHNIARGRPMAGLGRGSGR
jgi:hypothetical protein